MIEKIFKRLIYSLFICYGFTNLYSQCLNGNAELNNFNGWVATSSVRNDNGFVFNNMTTGLNPNNFSVTNVGYDTEVGGNLLSTVGEGLHSFKIGNTNASEKHADRLSYTFTVTPTNANFGFMFAMVLQDGEHTPKQINPFFSYFIQKGSNINSLPISQLIYSKQYIADKSDPFFKTTNKNVVWKDWSYECVDLSRYIGQVITISFIVADCSQGGHWGYAYIDGLCSDPAPIPSFAIPSNICYSDDIIMNATDSKNEDSYFISVQESDQWWNRYGTEHTQWFVAQKAGVINLKDFIQSQGGSFKCNTYYRIKLAVSNKCVPWSDLTKLIYIRCPQMNVIPDVTKCCSTPNQVNYALLGPATNNPNSFTTWQPSSGIYQFNTSGQSAGFLYNQNGYVDVTVTDVSISFPPLKIAFCSASQRVNFLLQDDFTVEIDTNRLGCCEMMLTAKVRFKNYCSNWESLSKEAQNSLLNSLNYSWSTGEKTPSITVSGASKEYNVSVSSKCKTHSASYFYNQSPAYWPNGLYTEKLQVNSVFIMPTHTNPTLPKKIIIIGSYEDAIGTFYPPIGTSKGIYKSEKIILRIFNRWGENFRTLTFHDCGELYQGDITWDGKDDNGNYVQSGTYVFKLYIKICGYAMEIPYCELSTNIVNTEPCFKYCWGHIPGKPWWVWGRYCCQRWEGEPCVNSVSVIL